MYINERVPPKGSQMSDEKGNDAVSVRGTLLNGRATEGRSGEDIYEVEVTIAVITS